MKAATSFEQTINDQHFTFARVYSETGDYEHYSVMADDCIFRITKPEHSDRYTIPDKDGLPKDIRALESQLSDAVFAHEARLADENPPRS